MAAVLDRLLAKDPADRFQTPGELVTALEPLREGAGGGPPAAPRTRRRVVLALAAACLVAVVAVPLLGRAIFEPGSADHQPQVKTPPSADSPAAAAAAKTGEPTPPPPGLRIVSLRVGHYRGDPPAHLGDLGETSFATRFDDDVKVRARFSAPAHCFLVAFNPDGKEQLCHPRDSGAPPPRLSELEYPQTNSHYFGLNDGVGLQAFVLAASLAPLPPYSRWGGKEAPWRPTPGDGVWRAAGRDFELLAPRVRGQERPRGAAPQPLRDLRAFFEGRPGVDALEVVAFPVKPKKDNQGR